MTETKMLVEDAVDEMKAMVDETLTETISEMAEELENGTYSEEEDATEPESHVTAREMALDQPLDDLAEAAAAVKADEPIPTPVVDKFIPAFFNEGEMVNPPHPDRRSFSVIAGYVTTRNVIWFMARYHDGAECQTGLFKASPGEENKAVVTLVMPIPCSIFDFAIIAIQDRTFYYRHIDKVFALKIIDDNQFRRPKAIRIDDRIQIDALMFTEHSRIIQHTAGTLFAVVDHAPDQLPDPTRHPTGTIMELRLGFGYLELVDIWSSSTPAGFVDGTVSDLQHLNANLVKGHIQCAETDRHTTFIALLDHKNKMVVKHTVVNGDAYLVDNYLMILRPAGVVTRRTAKNGPLVTYEAYPIRLAELDHLASEVDSEARSIAFGHGIDPTVVYTNPNEQLVFTCIDGNLKIMTAQVDGLSDYELNAEVAFKALGAYRNNEVFTEIKYQLKDDPDDIHNRMNGISPDNQPRNLVCAGRTLYFI